MTRNRILVPLDFQRQSDLALKFAGHLATKLNAMISCMYVIEEPGLLMDKMAGDQTKHKLRREAENRLSERVHSILSYEENIPFEIMITSGKVYQKVLEKSIDLNAQIILMGRNGSSHEKTKGMGSNAKRIMAQSMIPVISVSPQAVDKRKHLILPLDQTKPCTDQLNWAMETALLLDAQVSVLSIIERGQASLRPVYLKKLEEARCIFSERNIACSTHLVENHSTISREIVSFSDRTEHGIILLMTCYHQKSAGSFRGSVAYKVLDRTGVPVLYVQPRNQFGLSLNRSSRYFQSMYSSGIPEQDPVTKT